MILTALIQYNKLHYQQLYLFTVYLTTISVAQTVLRRTEVSTELGRLWDDAVVV
jgi:hypothetical protein